MDGWWGAGPVVSAESATPSIYIYMPRDGHRYPCSNSTGLLTRERVRLSGERVG